MLFGSFRMHPMSLGAIRLKCNFWTLEREEGTTSEAAVECLKSSSGPSTYTAPKLLGSGGFLSCMTQSHHVMTPTVSFEQPDIRANPKMARRLRIGSCPCDVLNAGSSRAVRLTCLWFE